MTFGLSGNDLFKNRQKDLFGVVYGFAGVSSKLRSAIDPVLRVGNEHTFEAFYNYSITPWLWLTADLQIIRPVTQTAKTSVIPASRLVVHF